MKSIKMILEGIGFLLFSICCILTITFWEWKFVEIPFIISMIAGIVLIISGSFNFSDK